jgi:transposase-like protein
MQEELTALLSAEWGEHTPKRQGYRNGYYQRDLLTSTGLLEQLNVPRDREGAYQTQVFEQYQRQEPALQEAITEMYVAGTGVAKVGEVVESLTGQSLSASAVSRITADLQTQFQKWQSRPLSSHYRVFYLDAVRFQVRHKEATDPLVILAVLAVDLAGHKELVALKAYAEETGPGWQSVLNELRGRGVEQVDVMVSDGHKGLTGACDQLFSATPRQRCLLHKERDVLAAFPLRVQGQIRVELKAIWSQPDKAQARVYLEAFRARYQKEYPNAIASLDEEVEKTLTFYDFPLVLQRYIKTTNAIESMFSQVRDRTDKVETFSTEPSCLTLVWATIEGLNFQRIPTGIAQLGQS